jgi:hypothetical protein
VSKIILNYFAEMQKRDNMQIMSAECAAQEAKDNLAQHLHSACNNSMSIEVIRAHIKQFLLEHKKSNSIARVRAMKEYIAIKRFNHNDPARMLQTAFNRTRKEWQCKTK